MTKGRLRHLPKEIKLYYEDEHILVVEKAAGLLTIATEREKRKTAYAYLTDYVRKGNPKSRARVFVVHRLDRETSGLLVFAKSSKAKQILQKNWSRVHKKYVALVHGQLKPQTGTFSSILTQKSELHVGSTEDDKDIGKLAVTHYCVLEVRGDNTLVELALETGRKHQIRVHLSEAGYPIVGDKRYGNPKDPHKTLALHAHSLEFEHPITGQKGFFQTKIPSSFKEKY